MPFTTLAVANGNVKRSDSNGSAGRPYSREDVKRHHQYKRINAINEVKRSSSENGHTDVANIRYRLRRGKTGMNRNGGVYENTIPALSNHNNNGPIKAFPLGDDIKPLSHNGNGHSRLDANSTGSTTGRSTSVSSHSPSTSTDSNLNEPKSTNSRIPLQRINGHTNMRPLQSIYATVGNSGSSNGSGAGTPRPSSAPASQRGPYKDSPPRSNSNTILSSTDPTVVVNQAVLSSGKDSVTFKEQALPPGMHELQQEYFVPGAKGFFQHKANFPLLKATDTSILKRKSSISLKRKNRVSVTIDSHTRDNRKIQHTTNGKHSDNGAPLIRSRSNASEIFVQPDMKIIQSCWSVMLAFMGDDKATVHKSHGNRLLGSLASSKRKYLSGRKRLWRKSSSESGGRSANGSPASSQGKGDRRKRPASVFGLLSSVPVSSKNVIKTSNPYSDLTVKEKVQYLVHVGIKLPYLRDELYCLIMKQLVRNPSHRSSVLGWILLSLITGSFPPSEKILPFVEEFLRHQSHSRSNYCSSRLARSLSNGPRNNPPCSLEIKAATHNEDVDLPIVCSDQSIRTVTVDPSKTSKEILHSLASQNRMQDSFGFCLVLYAENKVVNLGAGAFMIMDALSQVERNLGPRSSKLSWKLYYRRDIFSPRDLYCSSDDRMATWFTFSQICGAVHSGEYECGKATDLALLVAHQYLVQNGIEAVDRRRIAALCEKSLPTDVYKIDKKNWYHMVLNTLQALKRQTKTINPIDIMAEVIRYAMNHFTSQFIRTFSITTFASVGGVCTYTSDLTLCVSHVGVTVRQGDAMKILSSESLAEAEVVTVPVVLLDVPVRDIKKVHLDTKNTTSSGTTLTIFLHGGGSYDITSAHGTDIYAILFRYIRDISRGANKESHA